MEKYSQYFLNKQIHLKKIPHGFQLTGALSGEMT